MSEIEENMNNRVLEDEIDLRQLFNVVWKGKILIISITTLVALSSITYALSLSNYFSSESVLVSRSSQDSSPLSQFSGLAAMGGIDLSGNSNNSTFKVMEIIQSREFVKHLIAFENILPSIIAAQHFDAGTQKLSFDPEIYDVKTKTWIREPSQNLPVEPTYLEAHRAYLEMLSITQDRITGFIVIKIEHISPVFAKEFLELIIQEANNLNREIDIDKSSKALNYLKIELSQTSLVEIKNSISKLIEGQLETRMMASIHEEYSLITLEPPFIPDKRSRPTRSIIVIFCTLIGGLLGVAWVLVRHFTSSKD
jgi:uncharacterized protein involved in exopolysaccharide biosynthesis